MPTYTRVCLPISCGRFFPGSLLSILADAHLFFSLKEQNAVEAKVHDVYERASAPVAQIRRFPQGVDCIRLHETDGDTAVIGALQRCWWPTRGLGWCGSYPPVKEINPCAKEVPNCGGVKRGCHADRKGYPPFNCLGALLVVRQSIHSSSGR